MNRDQKQKIIFITSLSIMVIGSLVLAIIMSKNLQKDTSQERMELTKEYKVLKENKFVYEPAQGVKIYQALCQSCHGIEGQGQGMNPPITKKSVEDRNQLLNVVLMGKGSMPAHYKVPHGDMAHVLTYIRKKFGDSSWEVTPLDIVIFKIDSLLQP